MRRVAVVATAAVTGLSPDEGVGDAKLRKIMTPAGQLAAAAARQALAAAGWNERREEVGLFLGVGASGGPVEEIERILRVSVEDGRLSMSRLGAAGIAASNPLFTFQTLNNFTLCTAAMIEGLGGPNAAFYSRGAGTAVALMEAVAAIRDGDCERALAGAADSALHPVTRLELERAGWLAQGLRPAEGAAMLALASDAGAGVAIEDVILDRCDVQADLLVMAPWGEPARRELLDAWPGAIDASERFGEALAASPALAWTVAVDAVAQGRARRVAVVSAGIDGSYSTVVFA